MVSFYAPNVRVFETSVLHPERWVFLGACGSVGKMQKDFPRGAKSISTQRLPNVEAMLDEKEVRTQDHHWLIIKD